MRQTLFYIPSEVAGVPLFGFGLLLALWAVGSAILLAWLIRRQGLNGETLGNVPLLALFGAAIAFLLPALSEPQGVPIRGYGVMLLVAVCSAVALAVYRSRRRGLDAEVCLSLAFWMFVAGIVGARAFYVIEYWREQFLRPSFRETLTAIANVTQGGLVVYGSLLGGGVAFLLFVRKHKLPVLAMADVVAPAMVLGLAIGRLGCFLNGCCYGGVCDRPWAVTFPWGSPPFRHQVETGLISLHGVHFSGPRAAPPIVAAVEPGSAAERAGVAEGDLILAINGHDVRTIDEAQFELLRTSGDGQEISLLAAGDSAPRHWTLTGPPRRSLPVHPAQLYSSLDALLLCLFLLAYEPFSRRDGELLALLLTIHPISRFLLEMIRVDEASVFGTRMSISQNVSLVILAGAALLWVYILRQPKGSKLAIIAPLAA